MISDNTSATAASSGSDLNGMAAWKASETIKRRMIQCAKNYFKNMSAEVIFRDNHIFVGNKNISFRLNYNRNTIKILDHFI